MKREPKPREPKPSPASVTPAPATIIRDRIAVLERIAFPDAFETAELNHLYELLGRERGCAR